MNSSVQESLSEAAQKLAALIAEHKLHIVFAESCTAGLVSATLAQVPGVSAWHCGSAVTYREETKTAWLGISPETIAEHNVVSEEVARQMATGVLRMTPEATISASITGHLGPNAPPELDGVAHIAVGQRGSDAISVVYAAKVQLTATERLPRQHEAALCVLQKASETIAKLLQ